MYINTVIVTNSPLALTNLIENTLHDNNIPDIVGQNMIGKFDKQILRSHYNINFMMICIVISAVKGLMHRCHFSDILLYSMCFITE